MESASTAPIITPVEDPSLSLTRELSAVIDEVNDAMNPPNVIEQNDDSLSPMPELEAVIEQVETQGETNVIPLTNFAQHIKGTSSLWEGKRCDSRWTSEDAQWIQMDILGKASHLFEEVGCNT